MKWLLSPVNPADINTIQGKYPSRPPLPAVAGNEGVGEIVAIGSDVQGLRIGDRVVPNGPNFGIWRTQANYNSKDVMKVYISFCKARCTIERRRRWKQEITDFNLSEIKYFDISI